MNIQRFIPPTVLGLGGLLGAAALFNFAFGDEPDYADLVPPPNEVVLREDAEQVVWLSTNRHEVEMRIDSIDVGLGAIKRLTDSGETVVLGESTGCFDTAVKTIRVENRSETETRWYFTLDTGDATPLTTFRMYYRLFEDGVQISTSGISALITVSSSPPSTYERSWSGLRAGSKYRLEASTDSHFPYTTTDYVEWTQVEDGDDVMSDEAAEHIDILEDTGVELIGCHEHEDILITLHGDEGVELNRYTMDVLEAPTPTPVPTATPIPTPTPNPYAGHATRRVCVDDQTSRGTYLTGDESVGDAFTADDFDLSTTTLESASLSGDYQYFFSLLGPTSNTSTVQLLITEAGAGNDAGLDIEQIYPVRVTATDANGLSKHLDVGIWLDKSTLSTTTDGICP